MLNGDLVVQGGIQVKLDHDAWMCSSVKLCASVGDCVQFSFGSPPLSDGSSLRLLGSAVVVQVLLGSPVAAFI